MPPQDHHAAPPMRTSQNIFQKEHDKQGMHYQSMLSAKIQIKPKEFQPKATAQTN